MGTLTQQEILDLPRETFCAILKKFQREGRPEKVIPRKSIAEAMFAGVITQSKDEIEKKRLVNSKQIIAARVEHGMRSIRPGELASLMRHYPEFAEFAFAMAKGQPAETPYNLDRILTEGDLDFLQAQQKIFCPFTLRFAIDLLVGRKPADQPPNISPESND